jgi:hypothetical protein
MPYYDPDTQILLRDTTNGVVLGVASKTSRLATPKGDYNTEIRFNADGLRDARSLRDMTKTDWVALGDSFTMGAGVDEDKRFADVLERMFQTNGIASRLFNVGIPENIIGYQRLLRYAESRTTNIHRLIVGICMENDLRDYRDGRANWDLTKQGLTRAGLTRDGRPSLKDSARTWLKTHSALYIALSFEVQKTEAGRRFFEYLGVARTVDELSPMNRYSEEMLASCRDEILEVVSGRDAVVLIIPTRLLWAGNNIETERRVHEKLLQLLRESNVPVVDMKPVFEKEGNPLQFYFAHDPHWNSRGHALAAAELFATIRSRCEHAASTNGQ